MQGQPLQECHALDIDTIRLTDQQHFCLPHVLSTEKVQWGSCTFLSKAEAVHRCLSTVNGPTSAPEFAIRILDRSSGLPLAERAPSLEGSTDFVRGVLGPSDILAPQHQALRAQPSILATYATSTQSASPCAPGNLSRASCDLHMYRAPPYKCALRVSPLVP